MAVLGTYQQADYLKESNEMVEISQLHDKLRDSCFHNVRSFVLLLFSPPYHNFMMPRPDVHCVTVQA